MNSSDNKDNRTKSYLNEGELDTRTAMALNLGDYIALSGKNQSQVAREAGISRSTLSAYVTGFRYPRPAQLQALARVLGTTVSALTDGRETDEKLLVSVKGEEDLNELLAVVRRLNKQDRKTMIEFAVFLYERHGGRVTCLQNEMP